MGTMTINVPPSIEQLIRDEMSSGLYESESDLIREAFRAWWRQNRKSDVVESPQETDPLIIEDRAFMAMHDQLVETHFGQHVAIHNGKLIDHDDDLETLALRVWAKYDEEVLIREVAREPNRVLHLRHPDHWARQKRKPE